MDEIFPLVNEEGTVIGQATRRECHSGAMLLHPVVHLHVINHQGKIFLQKRGLHKDIQPGKWDTAVGGHVDLGEDIEMALRREASEELGITDFTPSLLGSYIFRSQVEQELVYSYIAFCIEKPEINREELDGGRFWTLSEIEHRLMESCFTENFRMEYLRFADLIRGEIIQLTNTNTNIEEQY